ncbi:MAG: MT-A70 family methyltransferase [Deltaproteobacteria bacterium]|jgi:N6-adenosine-specific RNA methylase IME4
MTLTAEQLVDEQPLPFVREGFGAIVADPPWDYTAGKATRIKPPYPTMSVAEICELPVGVLGADRSQLYLWVTASFLEDGFRVARAWGYEPKSQIVWVKARPTIDAGFVRELLWKVAGNLTKVGDATKIIERAVRIVQQIGMGSYVRVAHELCLVCTRGGMTAAKEARGESSVIIAPRAEHSRKPDELLAKVEKLNPGPYLELFARRDREGWAHWGNELGEETTP